jgi:hypothetical protein
MSEQNARYAAGWYYCWLIERRDRPQPMWWSAEQEWTDDAHKALWYARRQDADREASEMLQDVILCEHGFMIEKPQDQTPPPAPLVEPPAQTLCEGPLSNPTFAECPITRRPYFMDLGHPERGVVPTFGGPFDSYTIPERDEDGQLRCERYCHDRGDWIEGGEPLNLWVVDEEPAV